MNSAINDVRGKHRKGTAPPRSTVGNPPAPIPRCFVPLDPTCLDRLIAWPLEPSAPRFVGIFLPSAKGIAWHTGTSTCVIGFAEDLRNDLAKALSRPGGGRLGDVAVLDREAGQGWAAPWTDAIHFLHTASRHPPHPV